MREKEKERAQDDEPNHLNTIIKAQLEKDKTTKN